MELVADFFADPPPGLSGRELMRELIRVGSNSNLRNLTESRSWQIVFAMRAVMNSAPDGARDDELLDWMDQNEREMRIETIETLYRPMAELFGFAPRPEYGERAWHLAEISLAAFAEGLSMRSLFGAGDYFYDLPHRDLPEAPSNWSIYALMFERIVETFFDYGDHDGSGIDPENG